MFEKDNNMKSRYSWVSNPDADKRIGYERQQGRKEELEWIKRLLEYSNFTNHYKLRYFLKKGDILEIDWGINVNAEFSNRHFGVVLADSNEFNPLVMVCPLKTNRNGAHPKSDIDLGIIDCLKTGHGTLAVINQIRTIDKVRIYTKAAIGFSIDDVNKYGSVEATLSSGNQQTIDETYRLEDDKVNRIIKAYTSLIQSNNF